MSEVVERDVVQKDDAINMIKVEFDHGYLMVVNNYLLDHNMIVQAFKCDIND